MSADGTVAISGLSISDDGKLAAYAIADAGSDWVKWYVREVYQRRAIYPTSSHGRSSALPPG